LHSEAIISAVKRNEGKYALYLFEELIRFRNVFQKDPAFKTFITQTVVKVV